MLACLEIGVFASIVLFGLIQCVTAVASVFWYPKLNLWKTSLQHSHSIRAKLVLTIFFS